MPKEVASVRNDMEKGMDCVQHHLHRLNVWHVQLSGVNAALGP